MIRYIRSSVLAYAGVCLLAAAMLSCGNEPAEAPEAIQKPVDVRVVTATPSAISQTLEATGSVVAFRAVSLASPAEGPVISLRVRQGDRVHRGDTLIVIGRREGAEAQIVSLSENVRKEEANLARVERLLEIDGNSREQRDQAKAASELAKAQLAKAQEAVRDYVILAPWDGMTARLFVEVGDYNYISPRQPLIDLYDPASLVIRMSVPEIHAAGLQLHAPVTVTLDAYPDTVLNASISRIYPFLDERMRTRAIEVTVSGDLNLLPGMFARTQLQTALVDGAIVIPAQAIISTPEGSSIAWVVADGRARRRAVQMGIEEADRVQITDGIRPGDSVIITGLAGLSDGRPVRVLVGEDKATVAGVSADSPVTTQTAARSTGGTE